MLTGIGDAMNSEKRNYCRYCQRVWTEFSGEIFYIVDTTGTVECIGCPDCLNTEIDMISEI